MKKQYIFSMFALCFLVWVILVDNVPLPKMNELSQDVGLFSRSRVKHWDRGGKLDILQDELLVYAYVDNREQLYYMEYKPHFEMTLNHLAEGTPVQLRYVTRFPKFWKRQLYDLRVQGDSKLRYSPGQLIEKKKEIWKYTGIMAGIFMFLAVLGLINKPRRN